jgi:hypothetical protein
LQLFDSYKMRLNNLLFEEHAQRQNRFHVVDAALEKKIQRLKYLLTHELVLICCSLARVQANNLVDVFGHKVHKVHLVHGS